MGFRGSDGTTNWIYNFDAIHTGYPGCDGCKVHDGFYLDYLSVNKTVFAYVATLIK